jgi:hypothetical protein
MTWKCFDCESLITDGMMQHYNGTLVDSLNCPNCDSKKVRGV